MVPSVHHGSPMCLTLGVSMRPDAGSHRPGASPGVQLVAREGHHPHLASPCMAAAECTDPHDGHRCDVPATNL